MKYLSVLSICLFLVSCGPSALTNEDIETHVLGSSSILNKVNAGDSWEDVKKMAGDYWEVRDDQESSIYQFRKDIDLGDEYMFVSFELLEGKVAAIGIDITSDNISDVALLLYAADLKSLYKEKFGLDLDSESGDDFDYDGQSYHYSYFTRMEEGTASSLTIYSFKN